MFLAYKAYMGNQMDDDCIREEVERIFGQADRDGDGTLSFSEWQQAGIDKSSVLEDQKLKAAFDMFDQVSH